MRKFLKRLFRPWKMLRDAEREIEVKTNRINYLENHSVQLADLKPIEHQVVIDGTLLPIYSGFAFYRPNWPVNMKNSQIVDKNGKVVENIEWTRPPGCAVAGDTIVVSFDGKFQKKRKKV